MVVHGLKHSHILGEILHPNDGQAMPNLVFKYIDDVIVDNAILWVGFTDTDSFEDLRFVRD